MLEQQDGDQTKEKIIYIVVYCDNIENIKVRNIINIVSNIFLNEKPDTLYFLFSSNGGNVDAGITLYNYLKSLPIKIIMHNIGSVDSIANVVFVAGKERYANPHSTFLFHGVFMNFNGAVSLSLPQVEEIRDRIIKNHTTIAGIICENTKLSEDEIKRLFATGETKDTMFALKNQIIHGVRLCQIPQDALTVTINFNS